MSDPDSAVLAEAARHGKITVAAFVRNLAQAHGVAYQPAALDAFAAAGALGVSKCAPNYGHNRTFVLQPLISHSSNKSYRITWPIII
jgi:hypothetical protein